jgi:Nuclease-related domain
VSAGLVGWRLRFRVSQDARNWQRGARGERHTARQLDRLTRHGWVVFHDLAVPDSRANADHLIIGPAGVFLADSKNWRGHLAFAPDGTLWHGSYPLTATLATIEFEAQAIADALAVPGLAVEPLLVVHGSTIPWGEQYLALAADTFDEDAAMAELRDLARGDDPTLEQAIRTCLAQPASLATRHRAIELLARVRYEDAPPPA